jgi:xanthine dehydrogenase YagT iron-sulfur-binding subunit
MTLDFARRVEVTLRLNGRSQTTVVSPRTTLLDWLRDDIGLTGAKKGCNEGACGTCTVLVDGRRMNGCLTLVVQCEGRSVDTVEGLAAEGGELHPVQQAFADHDAFQCGYCTPGQLCSAAALLTETGPSAITDDLTADPPLTPGEIRERMSGNLCRCGAYVNIVRAITSVAGP